MLSLWMDRDLTTVLHIQQKCPLPPSWSLHFKSESGGVKRVLGSKTMQGGTLANTIIPCHCLIWGLNLQTPQIWLLVTSHSPLPSKVPKWLCAFHVMKYSWGQSCTLRYAMNMSCQRTHVPTRDRKPYFLGQHLWS